MIRDPFQRAKFMQTSSLLVLYIEMRMWRNWQTRWI